MIENPSYSRKFHGEYDVASVPGASRWGTGGVEPFVSYLACKDKDSDYMTGQPVTIEGGIQSL